MQDSQGNQYLSEMHAVKTGASTAEELRTAYDDANLVKIGSLSVTAQNQLILSAEVTNLTDTEAVITLKNLTINGKTMEETAEAFGTGENWGLLKDEKQILTLNIPFEKLAGTETIQSITFDLVLSNAADAAEIGTVPVEVTLLLALKAQ